MHENINRGVSTGYCFTFQRTGACTEKSCKFIHVHPSRSYPSFQSNQYNRPNKSTNKQSNYLGNEIQSQDLVITTGMIHVTQAIDLMLGVIILIRLGKP